MKTAAIVVAWHQPEATIDALASLFDMAPAPDHVICIAQEFTAEECRWFEERRDDGVDVIYLEDNIGFSAAANLAMTRAAGERADWVLLLNNDATVDRDCLAACLEDVGGRDRVAVVGPAINFTDDPARLWYGGGQLSHRWAFTRHRGLRDCSSTPPASSETEYIPGCCAVYSMAAWRTVGPFREDYFMYFEDAEWCARARAQGWRCRYLGRVLCSHAVGVSSGRRGSLGLAPTTAYYLARNSLRFALDTPSPRLRTTRLLGILAVWSPYNAWRVVRSHRTDVGAAYLAGLADALRARMGRRPAPAGGG